MTLIILILLLGPLITLDMNLQEQNIIRLPSSYTQPYSFDVDLEPFIYTTLNDFMKRKDKKRSDVFSLFIRKYRIQNCDVVNITVLPHNDNWKFLLSNADSLGSSVVSIAYVEREGKLFYWNVDGSYLTQDVYNVLQKYDFIEHRDVPDQSWIRFERGEYRDGEKNYSYYFCKEDPNHFRRTYLPYPKPPKRMRCKHH